MPYTEEEGGRVNNYAKEPKVYGAKPPTKGQQRNYVIWGVASLLLISGVLYVAYSVSNLG
ncbi:MAG: hypothetical protein BRC40_01880 [Cyanobacteria bacterium QH_8_48_120]|jgi:hypothetical protein|nr:MAG: hypothetical protein BRC34_05375 [Cyanobacteria bacterium QH_1_48_107]PSO59490.1 MAG: hypothetical protein BRC36_15640 [Cyanobacteria bacterium QH_2_48_84]PSO60292.1 MAG: hypothetical protein BRC35_02035 [Cyanobacteria bacterium QH_10_48_56]PSO62993.1 MAG: hypothetical protein BRC38_14520 [Cyanobacteria bacterium QH_6_48_35]PSO64262.1 MAG: hypothetical protein BRC39_03020 [Cyanobacteria bacterium QH_7_48_89]PSO72489.1 MAG: hypothetical protein BRC37_11635 [Cyanobacteria bacterium QH_3_